MSRTGRTTREQAIQCLRECERCGRWITVLTCDHCWVDRHQCPPTLVQAQDAAKRIMAMAREAEQLVIKIRDVGETDGS